MISAAFVALGGAINLGLLFIPWKEEAFSNHVCEALNAGTAAYCLTMAIVFAIKESRS